jgi:uncharacterized lipoprotein
MKSRIPLCLLIATAVLASSGCSRLFRATCVKPEDFASAVDRQPLKIPPGLDAPDARAALPIPPLNEPERPRAAGEPCLDAPPRYVTPRETRPSA